MLRFLFCLLAVGCSHRNPQPSDTKFDENKRDWAEVYVNEVNSARRNNDPDAYRFFMRELILEINRLNKEKRRGG